jgi:aromatic ring-opening dioxygenase LigB subunit
MRAAAATVVEHAPDAVVVVSPHTPRARSAWGVLAHDRIAGDFARFGAPTAVVSLPGSLSRIERLHAAAVHQSVPLNATTTTELDHGALVPLHFLAEAGWSGPTIVIALPWQGRDPAEMGRVIAAAALPERWAVVASGDMSHRLQPGAPAGYDPRAVEFDRAFAAHIAEGRLEAACQVAAALRERAAEDVVDSVAVASAAVGWNSTGYEFLAYEGPFGVGYLEAILHREAR